MSKVVDQKKLDLILKTLSSCPDGAGIKHLQQALPEIPLRTLQYRLRFLVKEGILLSEGRGRATRYRLNPPIKDLPLPTLETQDEIKLRESIPLSAPSQEIQSLVNLPMQARKYISYQREFLDEYTPNQTQYLPLSVRKHLLEVGKTDGPRPAGTYARQVYDRLLIDLSWNSSRLEGNTYSLLETERLLELSEAAEGKDLEETQMILNHKMAIEFLVDSTLDIGINRRTLLNLHALLSNNLLHDSKSCGRLRTIPVGIAHTVYLPTAIPVLIEECFQAIINKARAITDPFEQAFFLMVHIPYLQPFDDVNKRVSRLAANIPLILNNLCPLSFVEVPCKLYIDGHLGVYELNRIELLRDVFAWAYERSSSRYSATCQSVGHPDPFRLRYRQAIYDTVTRVILGHMDKKRAIETIKKEAQNIASPGEAERFILAVEEELRSLHEGNIARYRLRPSEYESWHVQWK